MFKRSASPAGLPPILGAPSVDLKQVPSAPRKIHEYVESPFWRKRDFVMFVPLMPHGKIVFDNERGVPG